MTSQIFVVSLLLFLTNGKLTTAVDSCCEETKSLINKLAKKVDRLTSCQENSDFKDCSDVRASGRTVSGVYRINIGPNQTAVDVFCDLTSPDRSWLVFQRRQDGSENFERTWDEYANGFGTLTREFWLGDSLGPQHGYQFSTKDADHDIVDASSCAQRYHGAWWYGACHYSNLNGLYLRGNHTSFADGIEWYAFRGYSYSMKATEMKIARID